MKLRVLTDNEKLKKVLCIVLLIAIAVLSITVISRVATSPESYKKTIQSIDDKKAAVMGVSAGAALASAGLAAIPGDVTTPIANQIVELSSYLFVVVCVLVLEKSLLTVLGGLSFNILLPISCVLMGIHVVFNKNTFKLLSLKVLAFALIMVFLIPFSLEISDMIYEVNKGVVEQVSTSAGENGSDEKKDEGGKSLIEKALNKIKTATTDVGEKATEKAKQLLNDFIDAIAVFIIAYCAIPVIVVVLMLWIINILFGVKISAGDKKM